MLSDEEKFRFDLEGYLVIPGVLSAEECAVLSQQSDHVWPRQAQDAAFGAQLRSVYGVLTFAT